VRAPWAKADPGDRCSRKLVVSPGSSLGQHDRETGGGPKEGHTVAPVAPLFDPPPPSPCIGVGTVALQRTPPKAVVVASSARRVPSPSCAKAGPRRPKPTPAAAPSGVTWERHQGPALLLRAAGGRRGCTHRLLPGKANKEGAISTTRTGCHVRAGWLLESRLWPGRSRLRRVCGHSLGRAD